MATQSMTGFGRGESTDSNFQLTVEIKSVNHRFKDVRFKMPSVLNSYEIEMKQKVTDSFGRGSFDVYVNLKRAEDKNKFDDLDFNKINSFLNSMLPFLDKKEVDYKLSPLDFLRPEFYRDQGQETEEEIQNLAILAFDGAIQKLKEARIQEGQKLLAIIKLHIAEYKKHFAVVESLADTFKANIEEKLNKRIQEYKNEVNVEQSRLLQEVIFYLEKMDVHEEINRIHSHLEKFQNLLESNQEVGRQIDFLIQELNRETNTIGSKSSLKEISNAVVQMKVQLEKIREQGLNIE